MSDQIIVTINVIGIDPDDLTKKFSYSRVFATTRSIDSMLNWAISMGMNNPTINDLHFSEYTGSSI